MAVIPSFDETTAFVSFGLSAAATNAKGPHEKRIIKLRAQTAARPPSRMVRLLARNSILLKVLQNETKHESYPAAVARNRG